MAGIVEEVDELGAETAVERIGHVDGSGGGGDHNLGIGIHFRSLRGLRSAQRSIVSRLQLLLLLLLLLALAFGDQPRHGLHGIILPPEQDEKGELHKLGTICGPNLRVKHRIQMPMQSSSGEDSRNGLREGRGVEGGSLENVGMESRHERVEQFRDFDDVVRFIVNVKGGGFALVGNGTVRDEGGVVRYLLKGSFLRSHGSRSNMAPFLFSVTIVIVGRVQRDQSPLVNFYLHVHIQRLVHEHAQYRSLECGRQTYHLEADVGVPFVQGQMSRLVVGKVG
mmetsp:Transcript_2241/g.4914  ORF Transcript_2241/g.4914 Transcript_2241/m.4914 type:complete len:280 (+) Transcript_2241:1339-2178(+)